MNKPRAAFTLMEMLVALAIIGIIIGGGFSAMSGLNEEQALRRPLGELKVMAKKAWQQAMQEQRAWQIVIRGDGFILQPRQAVNAEDARLFQQADEAMNRGPGYLSYKLEPEVRVEVRHFGEDQWHEPRPDVWVFEHSGLCEPISVRLVTEYATVSVQFDPLTAAVAMETFEANP